MKSSVAIAIFLFTGCYADMWQEQAKPNTDILKNAFWDYVAKSTLTTDDILQKIRESELGREVSAKFSESTDAISEYEGAVHKQMTPLTQELLAKIAQNAKQLKLRLEQDLSSAKTELDPYIEELTSELQQKVEELKKDVAPITDPSQPTIKDTLGQKTEALRVNLEESINELRARLEPQAEEVKQKLEQHLQEFQKNMAPFLQSSEAMHQKLDPYANDLKSHLTSLWKSFTKSIQ